MNSLAHYLETLSDPMSHAATLRAEAAFVLRALAAEAFGRVVCVPVRGEAPTALARLLTSVPSCEDGPVLTVLVLAADADDAPVVAMQNAQLELWLDKTLERVGQSADLRKYYRAEAGVVLVIDRSGPGRRFAAGKATAAARKLAGDVALRLWYEGVVAGTWLSFVDAEMIAPQDFLKHNAGADSVAMVHPGSEDLASAFSVRFESYAQAGGWCERMHQELAVLGRVSHCEGGAFVKASGTHKARSLDAGAPQALALAR